MSDVTCRAVIVKYLHCGCRCFVDCLYRQTCKNCIFCVCLESIPVCIGSLCLSCEAISRLHCSYMVMELFFLWYSAVLCSEWLQLMILHTCSLSNVVVLLLQSWLCSHEYADRVLIGCKMWQVGKNVFTGLLLLVMYCILSVHWRFVWPMILLLFVQCMPL